MLQGNQTGKMSYFYSVYFWLHKIAKGVSQFDPPDSDYTHLVHMKLDHLHGWRCESNGTFWLFPSFWNMEVQQQPENKVQIHYQYSCFGKNLLRTSLFKTIAETSINEGLFTHSDPVTVTIPIRIKFYNCANGDVLSDGQNGFHTHSARLMTRQKYQRSRSTVTARVNRPLTVACLRHLNKL